MSESKIIIPQVCHVCFVSMSSFCGHGGTRDSDGDLICDACNLELLDKYQQRTVRKFRGIVLKCMADLYQGCREFEWTTHGSGAQNTIDSVCEALVDASVNPSAFTISELAQRLQKFLKENGAEVE